MDKAQAEAMREQIEAGKVLFTKAGGQWLIVGKADTLTPEAIVEVSKRDGSTKKVIVGSAFKTQDVRGVSTRLAHFDDFIALPTDAGQPSGYTVKHDSFYGTGRVYHDQPGATYYDDGKTQIWDNS